MKKIVTIFLLFITFFGVLGYNFMVEAVKEWHREEMMEKFAKDKTLPESIFTKVQDSDNLIWVEKGKEFYYNDKLYDVIKTTNNNGAITYLCLSDDVEKTIIEKQNKATTDNTNNPTKDGKQTAGKQIVELFCTDLPCLVTINLQSFANQYFTFKELLITNCSEINTPPPQLQLA